MVQTADYQQIKKHVGIRSKIGNGFIYGLLIIWALIVLFPFYCASLAVSDQYPDFYPDHNGDYDGGYNACGICLCKIGI